MNIKATLLLLLLFLALGCGLGPIQLAPSDPTPITEIEPGSDPNTPAPADPANTPVPVDTPIPAPTDIPTLTPYPSPTGYTLAWFSTCPPKDLKDKDGQCCPYNYGLDSNNYCAPATLTPEPDTAPLPLEEQGQIRTHIPTPRHGLWIALILPVLIIGIPWLILEVYVVRYVQPKGLDISTLNIKAKDGLFLKATISVTAQRQLNVASARMSWSRVAEFLEKALEQEIIHDALQHETLELLEEDLKQMAENFTSLPIVRELEVSFGVHVVRFNIEASYPQETMDALNRKAEASAGGTAYRAYAAAARLNPDSRESRELYKVYQETRGQVDAARNLGGGLTNLAAMFGQQKDTDNSDDSSN